MLTAEGFLSRGAKLYIKQVRGKGCYLCKGEIRVSLETRERGSELEFSEGRRPPKVFYVFYPFSLGLGVTCSTQLRNISCLAMPLRYRLLASRLKYIISCVCRGVEGTGCWHTLYHPPQPSASKLTRGAGSSHR